MSISNFDVIIVGGGPAGLSAGLVLGRSRINTLVFNEEQARNFVTGHSHGFLTQDSKHPRDILEIAKKELSKYPNVKYKKASVSDIKKENNIFSVKTIEGNFFAKRLILATGYSDNISELGIKGLENVYGKTVHLCPFCDGFEFADKKLAIFADANNAFSYAKKISHWSKDLVVFTNGENLNADDKNALEKKEIKIVEKKISKVNSSGGILESITLEDNSIIKREAGFLADSKPTENTKFAKKFKIPFEMEAGSKVYDVDQNQETKIHGLYIIGDAKTGWSGLSKSVADGSIVGTAITRQIIEENWKN